MRAIDTAPAVLPIAMDPAAVPTPEGVNDTFRAAVCPGTNVVFAPAPLTPNPVPAASTLEIVTLAFPALVRVTPSEAVLPIKTLPKSNVPVLEVSSAVAANPVPFAEITSGVFGALFTSEIEPEAFPGSLRVNI